MEERGFSSRDRLVVIFILDVLATMGEALGATYYSGNVLWGNCGNGTMDVILFVFNIFGIGQETRGKRGLKIANFSDLALGAYFAIVGSLAFAHLFGRDGQGSIVNGKGMAFTALAVAAVNAGCAWLCPQNEVNGRSARLKLQVGIATNLAAILAGGIIHLTGWHWVDQLTTGLTSAGVVTAVIITLLNRRKPVVLDVFPDGDGGGTPLGI